jgi:hypothetical protein
VVEHLVVRDLAAPREELGRRRGRVELVPHHDARLLQHVVGVGPVRDEREDVGVQPALVLEERSEEQLVLVRGGRACRGVGVLDHERHPA